MVYLGIDHGTNAIRFAVLSEEGVLLHEIPRADAGNMEPSALLTHLETHLGFSLSDFTLACLTYSMGDNFSTVCDIRSVSNRGVLSTSGVGKKTDGGTKIFDLFANSACPAVLLPGLHQGSPTDERMSFFSHQASPEKIGTAYHAHKAGYRRFILSDIGSNTVTLAVSDSQILGAIDACIFAPGTEHGPLDVQAIRNIDAGRITANDAFSTGGVGNDPNRLAFFAAMEISALDVLMKEYGSSDAFEYDVLISGSGGDNKLVVGEISRLLQRPVSSVGKWAAAIGCAEIAKDIDGGEKSILGISVDYES
jgi:putative methanogenesis marker protein 12